MVGKVTILRRLRTMVFTVLAVACEELNVVVEAPPRKHVRPCIAFLRRAFFAITIPKTRVAESYRSDR